MYQTIYEMFREQVEQNADKTCIFDDRRSLTRGEFAALVDTLARRLPEDAAKVGIVMEHSVEMIAAIFAVLKTGRAYVPVEPFFPQDRISFMMQDAGVDVVLTMEKYVAKLGDLPYRIVERDVEAEAAGVAETREAGSDTESAHIAHPGDLAYILYTSGSTGKPKGVSVRNENVCHYIRAFRHEFHPSESDTMLQYSVCSFDIFVEEVFTTLCSGATLAIPSDETKKDMGKLMKYVEKHGVTIISGFPYLLLEMNSLPDIPASLRLLISGGDVLRASYIANLVDKVDIYNTYGPSETTVCASYFRCNGVEALDDGTYPIGKGVLGTTIKILDEHLAPVPDGKVGEICILGGGVSSGYIGDRRKENEAFVKWEDGSMLYRSGDLGYLLPDGNIAFLHRKDTQVMILGKRVEPTEIEDVLCNCPEIKAACVRPYSDEHSLSYLVAYIVLNQEGASLSTLKKELARFLPTYMIPEFFVRMPALPLNANGKLDTELLPIVMKEGDI